ncbi:M20/M25/M40 family metallo-hydrolase [Planctomonas sp. JC2975]|uniref:M20/M25/M40 family metallo-hydrolase n=1 Tax=Planctomonas sp. JC2975 TaxID=2729626 RepID=UPI001473856A|nr:M20/M25/M40 family metallo-hydrolase [Planctomonas sp. JC2975]NNC13058.1 M20/M25/M40 family metallo-hydrolase [Planctomonas sp. JC2975]
MDVQVRVGIAERMSRMVRIPTVSAHVDATGPGPFHDFEELLRELYPLVHERLEFEKITDFGLLFRWPGRTSGSPALLMAHYDVVPVGDEGAWSRPPFDGVIDDGVVWGRGTLDDKGAVCVLLDAVENLLAADFTPARDLYVWLGGNEESHGAAAREAAAEFQRRGIHPWIVLDEGGAVVDEPLKGIRMDAAMVGVSEKGIVTITLTARSDPGHASAPPKLTATDRIARAASRLRAHPFPARMPQVTRDMFRRFVPATRGAMRVAFRIIVAVPWLGARMLAAMAGEAAAVVRTTLAVTMLGGGTAANVLPEEASAVLNVRIAPGETATTALRRVRRVIRDRGVTVSAQEQHDPSPISPVDGEQFRLLSAAVSDAYDGIPSIPYIQMSATDSRYFHVFSPATYRFSPLKMTGAQRESIHGIDEHVTVDALERGERFYRRLIEVLPNDN